MKNKIEQYELKLSENEIFDVVAKHEKLSQSEENKTFAEFKATVEALRQELNIAKARHAIEFEDLRKQADYLET
jgi:tellurite resistance protein